MDPMKQSTTSMRWMALLAFGGLGLFAFISGLAWGWHRYSLYSNGMHAPGTVVELYQSERTTSTSERREGRSAVEIIYYPVIEFYDNKEAKIRFKGATGSNPPEFEVGAPVKLVYDPTNPYEALVETFDQLWLGPVAATIAGFVMFTMGVAAFYFLGKSEV